MILPFSVPGRLRVSTCKSFQARPMLVAITSTERAASAAADGANLEVSLMGTLERMPCSLQAAMGRTCGRIGVSAFDACGLCEQIGPMGLMGLIRRTSTSEAFSPTGWWICTHSVYADTPTRPYAVTPLQRPNCFPRHDRPDGSAFQVPAFKGSVTGARQRFLFLVGPFSIRVEQGDIGIRADAKRPFPDPQQVRWVHRVHGDKLF